MKNHIVPYFEPTGITLGGLQARHIQSFYLHELETLKATSVLRQHANLHKALKYAVKLDLIPGNPVDKVERPKPEKYLAAYYTAEEMEQLFEASRGHRLELVIQFAAFYGLRRGEVLGLRWDAVDFEAGTLTIRHIVTSTNLEAKHVLVEADRAKTKSSLRTLPLVASFAQRLRALKEQQAYNEKLCGNCYKQKYKGYLFVDEMGNLILPNAVTDGFARLLADHGLRKIRFHDLRHSCASLLLKQGVPMKQIQEWLGHSDIATTANIYAHLDSQSKQLSAATMEQALPLPEEWNDQSVADINKARAGKSSSRFVINPFPLRFPVPEPAAAAYPYLATPVWWQSSVSLYPTGKSPDDNPHGDIAEREKLVAFGHCLPEKDAVHWYVGKNL